MKPYHYAEPSPHDYCSDVDGVRFLVVDPKVSDMAGWSLLTGRDGGDAERVFFAKEKWFRWPAGGWNGLGFGDLDDAWAVIVNHGEGIYGWIPPTVESGHLDTAQPSS